MFSPVAKCSEHKLNLILTNATASADRQKSSKDSDSSGYSATEAKKRQETTRLHPDRLLCEVLGKPIKIKDTLTSKVLSLLGSEGENMKGAQDSAVTTASSWSLLLLAAGEGKTMEAVKVSIYHRAPLQRTRSSPS